jgi:predicted Ser/Thr protein kinase
MAGLVGQTLDHYRLVEQVGQGGMATVFRALDTRTMREVAVKVLSPTIGSDKRFVRRFRREANFVSRIKHPNIIPVIGYGESRGFIYLAMPFIQGETLQSYLVAGRISDEDAARWIGQVAGALDFAHRQGIVHRDVKPSNVIIDREGNALLTDFGLARFIEGSNTLTGSMLMGTPAYIAPEQGKGMKVDGRSDEYSLGVILYQIATGTLPFDGDTPVATVLMHIQDRVPPPRQLNPDLSPDVETVILKSLAKAPTARFPSVAALNRAYQAALAGEPVPGLDRSGALRASSATLGMPRMGVPADQALAPARRTSVVWIAALGAAGVLLVAGFIAYPSLRDLLGGGPATDQPEVTLPGTTLLATTPAAVLAPSATLASTPTATPVVSADCPGLRLINFSRRGTDVIWRIDNGYSSAVRIVGYEFSLPDDNPLLGIYLGGEPLWEMPPEATPSAEASVTVPAGRTTVETGALPEFRLRYRWGDNTPSVYALTLLFENGCTLGTSW